MVSLTTSSAHCAYPQNPISSLNFAPFPSVIFVLRAPHKRVQICGRSAEFGCNKGVSFSWFGMERVGSESGSRCCGCKKGWESEGDSDLEEKILEFMEKSDKPGKFPTRQELVNAGRFDLVEAIRTRGGWFSLGWEVEDGKNKAEKVEKVKESEILAMDFDIEELKNRAESCEGSGFLGEDEVRSSGFDLSSRDSAQLASSSGRSFEMSGEEEIGVEGILSRLEKERNSSFSVNLGKYGNGRYSSKVDEEDKQFRSSADVGTSDPGKNRSFPKGETEKDMLYSHYTTPNMWRIWSNQRAGLENTEFEAAEIYYDRNIGESEGMKLDIIASKNPIESSSTGKDITHDQIRSRLQDLKIELSSVLRLLRSNREKTLLKQSPGNFSSELQDLSDAWEFQETEIMNAQERLRSIRAKLSVLEGKMALAIINAQKVAEEKHKRIEAARRASHLLRTTRIVWPNSASEVLLAGSFDGWTTQRKMEKSKSGIFSVCLKLYPGRYEIKFVVDGKWKIDPLRPIVDNNGYENNILIIT